MADYAIHDTTLTDISNVVRKKEGSSALIDPADYPKRINLMGMLEEKSASGSIVTFADGADDVPLKSCEVALPASLDGYSRVDVVQCGKNLVNIPDSEEITRNQLTSTIAPLLDDFLHGKKGNYTISAKTAETVENANFITIRINYTDSSYSSNVYIYRGSTHESGGITGTFSISSDPTKTIDNISFGGNTGTAKCAVSEWQIEANAQVTAYEPYVAPTTYTASLGRTIYGGTADIVNGEGKDENGNDFTFTGQEIPTRLGYNAFWSDEGDTEVTYRASGTVTPIQPTLITKSITANGTYMASDDDADGYDEVTVNVPSIQSIAVHSGKLNIKNGTITEDADYCYTDEIECPNGRMRMDFGETSNGDFIGMEMLNNGTHSNYWVANDRFRSINLSSYYSATKTIRLAFRKTYADMVVFIDYSNSKLYSPFTMLAMQETSAPSLLSMSPSEEVNENIEEVEEDETT